MGNTWYDLLREVGFSGAQQAPPRPPRRQVQFPFQQELGTLEQRYGDVRAPLTVPTPEGDGTQPGDRYHRPRNMPQIGQEAMAPPRVTPTREEQIASRLEREQRVQRYGQAGSDILDAAEGLAMSEPMELTGLPSVRRAAEGFTEGIRSGDPQSPGWAQGWGNGALAALQFAAPEMLGIRGGRLPPRPERSPFRFDAPPPPPPETNDWFDVYHATNRVHDGPLRRSGSGALGPGFYAARQPETTEVFAGTPRGGRVEFSPGAHIMPLRARGRMASEDEWDAAIMRAQRRLRIPRPDSSAVQEAAVRDLQERGFAGVEDPERDFLNIFDPAQNVRSRFDAPPPRIEEPVTPIPVNPTREIGAGGLPIRERQPFRQSLVGGSDDLRGAAALREAAPDAAHDGGLAGSGERVRPMGPPSRLYHGTTTDVDEFRAGSHFGTSDAANARLRDNGGEGARIYSVEAPQGAYVRVTDAGDAWHRGSYWADMARNRSPRNDAEAALFRALRRDPELASLRGDALYARLEQHFRDNGFVGAIYANQWEGGESVFLPGRLSAGPKGGPRGPEPPPRPPLRRNR